MPAKINMFITNGNLRPIQQRSMINKESLASYTKPSVVPLNSSMIGRIHNAKSGCGSCGRH